MKYLFLLPLIILIINIDTEAQNILEWRGLNRSGYFPGDNLLREWPEEGPELLLHVQDLPEAYSSVIMKDNLMYTTGIKDTVEMLICLDMKGEILWKTVYGNAWGKSYPNARCTPTIEGEYAYMISGAGDMACINIKSGELKWSFDAFTKFGGICGTWGTAESPLIIENKMIYTPCGNITTLIAVDKATGETIWKTKSIQDQSAYCSPILMESEDLKMIVTVTGNYILGVDAEKGTILWKFHYTGVGDDKSGYDINPITPIYKGDEIFVTSGYNHAGLMLKLNQNMDTVKLKWKTEDLDSHHGGVVEHKGYIYGSNFTTVISGKWACIDWETGELQYEESWFTKGQIISTDDYLICYDERKGNIALVHPTPNGFNIISSFKVKGGNGPHWCHPTIYDEKLFLRHGKSLLVWDIGGE